MTVGRASRQQGGGKFSGAPWPQVWLALRLRLPCPVKGQGYRIWTVTGLSVVLHRIAGEGDQRSWWRGRPHKPALPAAPSTAFGGPPPPFHGGGPPRVRCTKPYAIALRQRGSWAPRLWPGQGGHRVWGHPKGERRRADCSRSASPTSREEATQPGT